ncbi:unnamed protein product [Tilletia controversa]|nr:unnamed protein product [Tilletia controversa]CAD6984738.1 unnamed protein product [Tilletia controversa]CAD7060116.1 unnamed protein product [Tilletia caries]
MSIHWDALTPDQLNKLDYFYVYKSTAYALLGWFAWEYILTLGFEIDVFRRKRPFGLHLLPYFVTRYGCLATLIPNIMLIHSRSKIDCQAAVLVLVVMAATCQIFSQVMFSLRALALWNYNRIVATCLFVIWIPHAALSYMAVIGIQTSWAREPLGGTGFCAVLRYSQFAVPSYALLLAVDIIVGIFILVRLFSLRKTTRSTFTDILARDLLLYLLCCVITCIAGIVVVLAGNPSVALRSMFYVVTTQVHAVLSCRAYVNTSRLLRLAPQFDLATTTTVVVIPATIIFSIFTVTRPTAAHPSGEDDGGED